ncbi:MAG: TolC family protein [Bacteroidota bacterium]|nr:TolC family protein [Bacteroidota bacterium]
MKKSVTYIIIVLLVVAGSKAAAGDRDYPDMATDPEYPGTSTSYEETAGDRHYPDSLLSYLEMAAANNPMVMQKLKEYQASLRKIPQAGSLPDPELSAGIFLMPMELVSGRQYAELKLMQMFPWFGVLRNARDEMSLMASARYEEFRNAKLDVFYEVQTTWYELYKVRKEISVAEENIDILNSIEKIALVRFRAAPGSSSQAPGQVATVPATGMNGTASQSSMSGMDSRAGSAAGTGGSSRAGTASGSGSSSGAAMGITPGSTGTMGTMGGNTGSGLADLYRIQIEVAELKNKINLLKNSEEALVARFNGYLDRQPQVPVFTAGEVFEESPDIPLPVLPDSINARNPMLAMLDYERKAWEAREKMAAGMGLPMTGLGVSYAPIGRSTMSASEMNGRDMVMPMISLTLPVYRKKYRAMREEAELMQEAAALNRRSTATSLQTAYYEALRMYNDAQSRKELYETQLTLASQSLDLILKGYSAATADLTDVLRLQQQTLDYHLGLVDAVADLNIAVARLNQLMAAELISQNPTNEKE